MEVKIRVQPQNTNINDIFFVNEDEVFLLEEKSLINEEMIFVKEHSISYIEKSEFSLYYYQEKFLIKLRSLTKDNFNRSLNLWILIEDYHPDNAKLLLDIIKKAIYRVEFVVPNEFLVNMLDMLDYNSELRTYKKKTKSLQNQIIIIITIILTIVFLIWKLLK